MGATALFVQRAGCPSATPIQSVGALQEAPHEHHPFNPFLLVDEKDMPPNTQTALQTVYTGRPALLHTR